MSTYVEEVIESLKNNNIIVNEHNVALGLRAKLGDKKIKEMYNIMVAGYGGEGEWPENVKEEEYNKYWVANKLIEMAESEPKEDGVNYPSHGWVNDELWPTLGLITEQLNKLNGVHCSHGVIYSNGSCYRSKGFWGIDFDTVEDFNHFLWAGCYRYLPLAKSEKWYILPNLGDPDYNENKLRMELHYMKLSADKKTMEKDFADFAKCVEDYSNDENEIKRKLEENK